MFKFTNKKSPKGSPLTSSQIQSDSDDGDSRGRNGSFDGAWDKKSSSSTEIAALRQMLLENERKHQEEKEIMRKQIAELQAAMIDKADIRAGTNPTANGFLSRTSSAAPMFRTHSESSRKSPLVLDNESIDRSYTPPLSNANLLRARTSTIESKDVPPELLIKKEEIQLLGLIGRGSFGEVWRALYKEEVVAVKVFISEEGDVASEIKVMARASSASNILSLVGVVIQDNPEEPSQVAIVTKYMSNGSMHDMLVNTDAANYHGKSIPILDLIQMSTQAAMGVLNLHMRGIIHRDLACRNLLVDAEMNVYVCDFGFARLRASGKSKGFTATNLGPVRWEAPESLKNKEFSEKTDVFSFGVSLYEMFSGLEPYSGSTNAAVAYKVISGERMRIPANVDPVVAELITSCWSPNPSARPEIRDVYKALLNRSHGLQNAIRALSSVQSIVGFLRRGGVMSKIPFNAGGKVFKRGKNRFFKISDDLRSLRWEKVQSRSLGLHPPEKSILLSEVQDILVGGVSANFLRYYGEGAGSPNSEQVIAPKAAFSLMTKDRSIDVICPSLESMNEWVRGLKYLINRLTPNAKDEVESVQESRGLTMNGERFRVIDGVRRWNKGRGSWNEEEVMILKRSTLSRLILGSSLLKFLHLGKPHERFFTLHHSLRHLFWEGGREGKKSKRVNLLEIKEVRTLEELGKDGKEEGLNIKGYYVKSRLAASVIKETVSTPQEATKFGLTLVDFDGERLLNLIAPNEGIYLVWLHGLRWALEEIAKLYPNEYPPVGATLVKHGERRSMKRRVTKTMNNALEAAVKAGRRGSRGILQMVPGSVGSTPAQTPVATPQQSPTHSPSISRQSSLGSSQGLRERDYDVFSEGGSGGESDGEGRLRGLRSFGSNRSSLSGDEDEVLDHGTGDNEDGVVSFKDVELNLIQREVPSENDVEEFLEHDLEEDEGYEGGISERNVALNNKTKSPKSNRRRKSNRGKGRDKKGGGFFGTDWKVVLNM